MSDPRHREPLKVSSLSTETIVGSMNIILELPRTNLSPYYYNDFWC